MYWSRVWHLATWCDPLYATFSQLYILSQAKQLIHMLADKGFPLCICRFGKVHDLTALQKHIDAESSWGANIAECIIRSARCRPIRPMSCIYMH